MPVDDVADENQEQPQLSVLEGAENGTDDEEEDTLYVNAENSYENEGAQGAPDEAPDEEEGAPSQNNDKREQDGEQETPLTVDKTEPPQRYNSVRGNTINYDHRYDHQQFTQLTGIICRWLNRGSSIYITEILYANVATIFELRECSSKAIRPPTYYHILAVCLIFN